MEKLTVCVKSFNWHCNFIGNICPKVLKMWAMITHNDIHCDFFYESENLVTASISNRWWLFE